MSNGKGNAIIMIKKYGKDGKLKEIIIRQGNVFLTCGIQAIWNIIAGNITTWQLGICAGNSNASASASQTCCQGNQQACANASSISVSSNQMSITALFDGNTANFSWNEVCVAFTNMTCSNCSFAPIDRMVQILGTKQPGEQWQVTVTLSIS